MSVESPFVHVDSLKTDAPSADDKAAKQVRISWTILMLPQLDLNGCVMYHVMYHVPLTCVVRALSRSLSVSRQGSVHS